MCSKVGVYRRVPVSVIVSLLLHQVIVEKVPKSSIPDIDKKKFLVPADLSGEFILSQKTWLHDITSWYPNYSKVY